MSRAFNILNLVLALGCALGLARILAVAGVHVPLDPNEGWNAYHTAAAMSGGNLYPGAGSFLTNNYPPLSFYVVGLFGGDHIVAGRIVALLAFAAVAASIFAAARTMGTSRQAASFGALWFVAGVMIFTDYVGMDDPQLLGHAIAMAGFLLLLRGNMAGAALAMAAALFVKHNLVAMPAAALIWLALFDRRGAIRFAAWGLGAVLLGLVAFRLLHGVSLFGEMDSPRLFSLALLGENIAAWTLWGATALAVMAALLLVRRHDRHVALCAIYALVAVMVGACFSGGAGVDMNVWFDAVIALALGAALAVDRLGQELHKVLAAFAYVVPLLCGLALAYDGAWLTRDFWLHPARDEAAMAAADIDFLKARDGPALCEMLSLCYWAGKPAEVDVFNLGQAFATRARSDDALVRLVEARRFRAVQFDSMDEFALGPRVKDAFARNYRVDHEDGDGVFLMPR
ncbi:MAG TPA: hypothetical protein VHZ29_09215 [Rhizomicrobium sp.]|jgi:hypothetical protein|nr:hypothetical protein [Rhizomicrobium sp.]